MKRDNALRAFVRRQNETLDVEGFVVRTGYRVRARIAVVSDLHYRGWKPFYDEILTAIRRSEPDLVAVLGDVVDGDTKDVADSERFISALAAVAPTVAIMGNNDCIHAYALREVYRHCGVALLEDETRVLPLPGGNLRITGLQDPAAHRLGVAVRREGEKPEHLDFEEALRAEALPNLVLLHRPELAAECAAGKPTLLLAGHAHGGQFRLPIVGSLYAPGQGLFPRLTSGLYALVGAPLIVSRGLGNHSFPLRLGNRPHLPVVEVG